MSEIQLYLVELGNNSPLQASAQAQQAAKRKYLSLCDEMDGVGGEERNPPGMGAGVLFLCFHLRMLISYVVYRLASEGVETTRSGSVVGRVS